MLFLLLAGGAGAAIANSNDDEIRSQAATQALVEAKSAQVVVVENKPQPICPTGYACDFERGVILKLPE